MALITAVSLFGDSMLYIVLPIHWKEVGLVSLVEVGILLSANRFIRLPLNPLISKLYTIMNVRKGLTLAILIAGSTTFLYGYAKGFTFWLILRCVWGLAWSIIRLGSNYLILDLSDNNNNRGYLMGTYNGLSKIGTLVGMFAGGIFVEWYGIKVVASVFGIATFMILPVIALIPRSNNQAAIVRTSLFTLPLLKLPKLPMMLLTVFLVMFYLDSMVTATLSHLIDIRHPNTILFGIAIGATTVAGILQAFRILCSTFLSPWIGKKSDGRGQRIIYLILALFLSSTFLSIVQFDLPIYIWLTFLLALLLTSSVLIVIMDAYITDVIEGKMRTAAVTTFVIVSDIGVAFGPVLGFISERSYGISTTYTISTTVLLLLSILWGIEWLRMRSKSLAYSKSI
ncbi:MAG: MFS transporter [Candidatus Cohnella colombiensis]|uniref:MFS transporter n=1 Tax=Candidatus Cohnella colombiensis TaxID=3121368 RepID=A0AA95F6L4_9BACL|nr:MAG: MFS transporter [Cohnella sp.]